MVLHCNENDNEIIMLNFCIDYIDVRKWSVSTWGWGITPISENLTSLDTSVVEHNWRNVWQFGHPPFLQEHTIASFVVGLQHTLTVNMWIL